MRPSASRGSGNDRARREQIVRLVICAIRLACEHRTEARARRGKEWRAFVRFERRPVGPLLIEQHAPGVRDVLAERIPQTTGQAPRSEGLSGRVLPESVAFSSLDL